MRRIYTCKDCYITVELEDRESAPPPGWMIIEQVDKKKSWYCNDCSGRFKPKEKKEPERPVSYANDLKKLEFKNKGEFYAACFKYRNLPKSKVDPIVKDYDLDAVPQLKLAWLKVIGS